MGVFCFALLCFSFLSYHIFPFSHLTVRQLRGLRVQVLDNAWKHSLLYIECELPLQNLSSVCGNNSEFPLNLTAIEIDLTSMHSSVKRVDNNRHHKLPPKYRRV